MTGCGCVINGPQPPVTSGAHRFTDTPERTSTLVPSINQPTAVQTIMPPIAMSRFRVMIGKPFFCGVCVSCWDERVWPGAPANAPNVFRCDSIAWSLLVRLRFLVEEFGPRALLFAKFLVELDRARRVVGRVSGRG